MIISFGDAHIYKNHFNQVKEQLDRQPFDSPILKLNSEISIITEFGMEDIGLIGYQCHDSIKAPMAV